MTLRPAADGLADGHREHRSKRGRREDEGADRPLLHRIHRNRPDGAAREDREQSLADARPHPSRALVVLRQEAHTLRTGRHSSGCRRAIYWLSVRVDFNIRGPRRYEPGCATTSSHTRSAPGAAPEVATVIRVPFASAIGRASQYR